MDILKQLIRANHQRFGLKTLKLFRIEPTFFAELQREAEALVNENRPSEVSRTNHTSNWTRPIGCAAQFSLLNRSGRFDDTSADHSLAMYGKRFHHDNAYPAIGEFVRNFTDAYNMRLNSLGPGSGLSKHKESLYLKIDGNVYMIRARFHLPVRTSLEAEMYLDGDYYNFEEGFIYLFNNGCVHSALNHGDDFRNHLVWDMFLTERTTNLMFGSGGNLPYWLIRMEGNDQIVSVKCTEKIGEYAVQNVPKLYSRLKLARFGIKPHHLQRINNSMSFYRNYYFRRPAYVPLAAVAPNVVINRRT